jgi:hypothetical protein
MIFILLWVWGFATGLVIGLLVMGLYCYREASRGFMITCPGCKVKFNSNDGLEDL